MWKPEEKVKQYAGVFTDFPQKTPTAGEPDGPLFGNGDLGVVVGGTGEALTFWLGKNDFWFTCCHPEKHGAEYGTGCIRGMGALSLCADVLADARFSARQEIGTADVIITLEKEGTALEVKAYAPYGKNVMFMKVKALSGTIPLSVQLKPMEDEIADCAFGGENGLLWFTKDYVKETVWDTKSAVYCKIHGWEKAEGVLQAGESLFLTLAVYTNLDTADYLENSQTEASSMTDEKRAQYRDEHLSWWNEFWASSGISIPSEPDVEKFWYASHYLMACCCQTGKFAPGIFGNWITTNQPNWAGDYHLNYNYQAPWWGVFSSNKVELADPYDQPLLDYIPQARKNAQEDLGCRGLYAKVGIGPRGLETARMFNKDGTENHIAPYWGQKSNAAYAAVNMVMRFYSTWDAEYARKYALPYLTEVADFWEDYLKFEDGRYVIYNDCIHENGYAAKGVVDWVTEDTPDYSDDFNPILTLGLLRVLFKGLLDISEYLGECEDRREKWSHILTHLSEYPTQERDGKTVFRYTEKGMAWCDGNSLGVQHIFPCGTIGLSSNENLLQIAQDTVTAMHRWSDYNAFPTFFTAAARVGYDPDIILSKFKEQFLNHSFPNLFIYYGGGGIECCSAVPSCINEMLFQSHEGVLRFFPVWDRKKDAAFQQLRGYGAFVVSAELKNGVVENITLTSEKGRSCSVLCPWALGMTVSENGKVVECQTESCRDGVIYTFTTKARGQYQMQAKKE